MAAPNSAFFTKPLNIQEGSATASPCLVALVDATKAVLMDRFYLDNVLGVDDHTVSPALNGFIGCCRIGSPNYYMHNPNRFHYLKGYDAGQMVFFNDAGLNTFGLGLRKEPPTITYANYLIIPSKFTSAWWVNSDRIGYQVRKVGQTNWITPNVVDTPTTLPRAQILDKNIAISIFGNPFNEGDSIELRPFVYNAEGNFYGTPTTIGVTKNINFYPASFRGNAPFCDEDDGTDVSVIMNDEVREWLKTYSSTANTATGRYLYSSIDSITGALTPAPEGWYQGLVVANQQRLVMINALGEIRESFLCSAPITEVLLANFSSVFGQGSNFTVTITVNKTVPFTQEITVSGQVDEMNGASVMRSFPFDVIIPSGASSADATTIFEKLQPTNKFRFNSAVATPSVIGGVATNPVKTTNQS